MDDRQKYIEERLLELSHKKDKDELDLQEKEDLERELNDLIYKDVKKESYKLPLSFSMYDTCYCMSKCATPCGRQQKPVGIYTASDLGKVCSDYTAITEEK